MLAKQDRYSLCSLTSPL